MSVIVKIGKAAKWVVGLMVWVVVFTFSPIAMSPLFFGDDDPALKPWEKFVIWLASPGIIMTAGLEDLGITDAEMGGVTIITSIVYWTVLTTILVLIASQPWAASTM